MKLLAFDASTEACSAALGLGDAILQREEYAPRRHAELILPMVDSLLQEAGLRLKDLDAVAFGRGPGSFTGVRLAAGIAQGLALGAGLPAVPVSSLAALAQGATHQTDALLATIDARMGELYWGLFEPANGGVTRLTAGERVSAPAAVTLPAGRSFFALGSGWETYGELLAERFKGQVTGAAPTRRPQARDLLPLARAELQRGQGLPPEQALPVYLRNEVAQKPRNSNNHAQAAHCGAAGLSPPRVT